MAGYGRRHFAATQQFGRFRSEADIRRAALQSQLCATAQTLGISGFKPNTRSSCASWASPTSRCAPPARPSRNIAWAGRQREEWKRIYQLFQRLEELAAQRR